MINHIVKFLDPSDSQTLKAVISLSDMEKKTLGFFPAGAFKQKVDNKELIVSMVDETVTGYILFSRGVRVLEIGIIHLCVNRDFRKTGIASLLINKLIESSDGYERIKLSCRVDFKANKIWPKLGFRAVDERSGRAISGSILTVWVRDLIDNSLFNYQASERITSAKPVIIDSCVFFSLLDESDSNHKEAASLESDWLSDQISIFVTDAIFDDIQNATDPKKRQQSRSSAEPYRLPITSDNLIFQSILRDLKNLFPDYSKGNDENDLKHIAYTISHKVRFFLTWDQRLLLLNSKINARWGIQIMLPHSFIGHMDELIREGEYEPARVGGSSSLTIRNVSGADDCQNLAKTFVSYVESEKKNSFLSIVRNAFGYPGKTFVKSLQDKESTQLGLIVYSVEPRTIRVQLLRTLNCAFRETITRFLLSYVIKEAITLGKILIVLKDGHEKQTTAPAAIDRGFTDVEGSLTKIVATQCFSKSDTLKLLEEAKNLTKSKEFFFEQKQLLSQPDLHASRLAKLEHDFYPGLILDSHIETWIVPIQPRWAMELFDEDIASCDLFGASERLALTHENVYYSGSNSLPEGQQPGRILWYVSNSKKFPESGSIRARSRLCEVKEGTKKEVFKFGKRFGVFEWADIDKFTKSKRIRALRFDDTKIAENPISHSETVDILRRHQGNHNNLIAPWKLNASATSEFLKLLETKSNS